MKATGKILRVQGDDLDEIEKTASLLQDFLDTTSPAIVQKLLLKVKGNPAVLKTALKFI